MLFLLSAGVIVLALVVALGRGASALSHADSEPARLVRLR
jgi:hypothetical protein